MNAFNGAARNNAEPMRFRSLGGWVEQPDDLQPALKGHEHTDVVVVGAGFAGLSTALELRARGANVIVLEQQFAGFGASGRNAGYLLGSMGIECEVFVKRVGLEQARKFVGFYDEAVTYVEERLAALDIDCDYTPSGIIRAAVHPSQEKRLRANMELGHALGSVTRFVDSAEMRARGIPPAFLFGSEQRGGTLNPGKYVNGLRRAAIKAGVKLYERTPVLSYCEGQVITCNTAQGIATAPVMVLATNAYTPQLGVLRNKVAPIRVSAIETQPLSAEQLASLGWQEREGLITPHYTMESHRLTAHDTLLLTVKQLGYAYGSKTPNVPDHAAYAALSRVLRERFPSLQGLAIRHCWSGYISGAYDFLPVVGVTGPGRTSSIRRDVQGMALPLNRSWARFSPSESAVESSAASGAGTQDAIHATRATSMVRHKDGLCGRQATGCMDRQESAQRQSLERLITMRGVNGVMPVLPCTD